MNITFYGNGEETRCFLNKYIKENNIENVVNELDIHDDWNYHVMYIKGIIVCYGTELTLCHADGSFDKKENVLSLSDFRAIYNWLESIRRERGKDLGICPCTEDGRRMTAILKKKWKKGA